MLREKQEQNTEARAYLMSAREGKQVNLAAAE